MEHTENCKACPTFATCKQKDFMHPDTEPVEGFVGCAELWCEEHKPADPDTESCGYWQETDSPNHCSECGRPLQCTLTDDGVEYVRDALLDGRGCCAELWRSLFAVHLEV